MATTEIEKKSLEAHVELCAQRYHGIETKLSTLEQKIEKLEEHIIFIREKLSKSPESANKTFIAIGTTLIGTLITGIIVILVNFVNK